MFNVYHLNSIWVCFAWFVYDWFHHQIVSVNLVKLDILYEHDSLKNLICSIWKISENWIKNNFAIAFFVYIFKCQSKLLKKKKKYLGLTSKKKWILYKLIVSKRTCGGLKNSVFYYPNITCRKIITEFSSISLERRHVRLMSQFSIIAANGSTFIQYYLYYFIFIAIKRSIPEEYVKLTYAIVVCMYYKKSLLWFLI